MIETLINGKYKLLLPEHRAARPEWITGWEVARIDSMLATIKNDDVVFDIGTEVGDISALIVKYTGCNIVLFEPNSRVWATTKAIWKANELKPPIDFFRGFLSDKTTIENYKVNNSFEDVVDDIITDHGFKQLYENYPDVPQITMDDYCEMTGIYPTVITMDVEGSEGKILRGAEKVLKGKKPIIYASLHPEFLVLHYDEWVTHLIKFVKDLGYLHTVLDYDHELHIVFKSI